MENCDVLIVGGGPAGSSCAWGLRNSGLDVAIIDKQVFPRDKVCGGWITPPVLKILDIDPAQYRVGRVLQPITSFRTGCIGGRSATQTDYGAPVSYGIRRREFDTYLLRRCGARLREGVGLSSLQRDGSGWIVNRTIRARLVVGAGGHFCPVARHLSGKDKTTAVVAQEVEFEMDERQQAACPVRATMPELYFCPDMKGYGWCFRKGSVLNIGLGRADSRGLPEQVDGFVRYLTATTGLSPDMPAMRGHAYFLYGTSQRPVAGTGFLLIGDAAGLAWPQSGEGILPAIESGFFAAETIITAKGAWSEAQLEPYAKRLAQRFGDTGNDLLTGMGRGLPPWLLRFAATRLLKTQWFVRDFVLDRWFLHHAA